MNQWTQLNPHLEVIISTGSAICIAWLDYGVDHDTLWKCVDQRGEVWDLRQKYVRFPKNITYGRTEVSEIEKPVTKTNLQKS